MNLCRRNLLLAWGVVLVAIAPDVTAQTDRAVDRRLDRNARQLQRQANQADYYSNEAWQQVSPWIQRYGIVPLARGTVRGTANAVANTVDRTVDAADGRIDGRFGFRNNAPQAQSWFYDYYTYTPTYYYGEQNSDRYVGAIRYFDSDGDGVYDLRGNYRDSDNDGVYDVYDRIDFYAAEEVKPQDSAVATASSEYIGPQDARRYKVEGEIASTKSAQVNGKEHVLVGLKQTDKGVLAIDVGPADAVRGKNIEVGSSIAATGAMETIGEKKLLVADTIRIGNGPSINIQRGSGITLKGTILDVTGTNVGSAEHYLAVVEVDGERQLVDLGPVATYKVKPATSTQIFIEGVPVRTHDHRVIVADQVRIGDVVIRIDRATSFSF